MKKFRYDINALRAIAVISVLLFHLQLPFFPGGFIGVDVFFVISGYLMTKIIFDGLDNNNFSFLNFWGKRVKRIIPALLVMVLAVTVAGYFLYLPSEYKVNENNATSSLMFYSNLLYWRNSGYFDSASDNNILLHTWSLSVEWQFYLIYPLLLWAMSRIFKNKNHILYLIISLTIILCLLSILLTYKSPVASFYLLPTRAWEMLFGGIALLCEKKIAYKNKVLLLVSYLIIFLSIFFFNNKLKWPGIFTLLPVVSTFFILLSNKNSYKILSNSVVQFLGKTSYSLYLWHWPLIVFAQYLGFQLSICNIVSIMLISLFMAFLSFRFVESIKFKTAIPILSILLISAITTAYLSKFETNNKIFKRQTLLIANYNESHIDEIHENFSYKCCFIVDDNATMKVLNKGVCLSIDTTKKNILLVGDSHAAQYSSSFKEAFKKRGINFMQTTSAGCFPFLSHSGKNAFCNELFNYIYYDFIVKNKSKINGIILSGNWFTAPSNEYLLEELIKVTTYLKRLGIPVVIIGQNETYTIPYPSIAAKCFENNRDSRSLFLEKKTLATNNFLKDKYGQYYIDVYNNNAVELGPNFTPYMVDMNHYSKYGADLAVKKIFADTIFQKFLVNSQYSPN